MKRVLSSLIAVSIILSSGVISFADEEELGLIPEETEEETSGDELDPVVAEEMTEEVSDPAETTDICEEECEEILSSDEEQVTEDPTAEDDDEPDEDLIEVSCCYYDIEEGISEDITIEYIDASEVEEVTLPLYASVSEAGPYIRSQAASRADTIMFLLTGTDYGEEFYDQIKNELFKHTGIPGQGDNLLMQMEGYNISKGVNGDMTCVILQPDYYTTAAQERAVESCINIQLDVLDLDGMTDNQKICKIYAFVCNWVKDDDSDPVDGDYTRYTAYGAAVKGKAVCQGFANYFYQMCLTAGVTDVRIDYGYKVQDKKIEHAWNLVKLDGKWYYLDSTSDRGKTILEYSSFLCGSTRYTKRYKSKSDLSSDINVSSSDYVGWLCHYGKYYYVTGAGCYATGWKKIGGKWYYFEYTGIMRIGWANIDGNWFYLEGSGAMKTGWKKLGGKWYYFKKSGEMVTGWQKISNKWYYFERSGAMRENSWLKYKDHWYYFNSNGEMICNTTLVYKGVTYVFDASGICSNP